MYVLGVKRKNDNRDWEQNWGPEIERPLYMKKQEDRINTRLTSATRPEEVTGINKDAPKGLWIWSNMLPPTSLANLAVGI